MIKKLFFILIMSISLVFSTQVIPASAALIELRYGSTSDLNVNIGAYKTVGSQLNANEKLSAF